MSKEFYGMKEEIKSSKNKKKFKLYIKRYCLIVSSVEKEGKYPEMKETEKQNNNAFIKMCSV